MFCHHCGAAIHDRAQFCSSCGQPVAGALVPPQAVAQAAWRPPTQVHVTAGRWIGAGWDVVKADLGNYILLTLLFFLLSSVPLISGALIAGIHIFTLKKLTGRRADIGDLFRGFNFFLATLVATILIGVFTFIGFLLLIIPGLIVIAMYKFTYLFIVDKRMDFWQAMQASHAVVRNDYFGFVWFVILAFLVNVLGCLCLFVGLFVTVPLTIAAVTVAYQEVVGFEPATADTV